MKFIPVTQSWIKFFAVCNCRLDYRFYALVVFLFVVLLPQQGSACVVSCKSSLNISLDEFGQAIITPSILLQDQSCDPNDFVVDITDPQGNSIGNVLTCDHVGLTMTATVSKISNGNSCSTLINVEDHINPVIYCSDTLVLCIDPTDPDDIGFPLAWDNCFDFSADDLNYSDEFIDLACFATQGTDTITSKIERTWTVTDPSGNTGTCIQVIYLKRATIDDVEFPLHRDGFDLPALDCNDDPDDLSLTGKPTINGLPIEVGGNCEIVVSHSDQFIQLCSPASFQILRTWTAIDYCSSDFNLNVQIIKVIDTTPPEIICPEDITIGTSSNSCDATVILPFATAGDDCSEFSITPDWAFGSGYGPFSNIPIGEYDVNYTAEDECGNNAVCSMKVTVIDDIPPIPICDLSITVDLTAFGSATVPASSFDDSSFDNCEVDKIEVSRDGILFDSFVEFNCSDVDSVSVPVVLRVWDIYENYNECVVNAIIDDKLNPAISCPSDVYIECGDDYTALALTGEPLVDDNCEIDTIYYNDLVDLNSCGVGSVTRVWTVKDENGNSAACVQMIYVEDNTPVQVAFPVNFVTYNCDAITDPSLTGEPQIFNDDCENPSVTFEDVVYDISPSCYSILREWVVVDWCIYIPNSGSNDGYWTHTQIIEIRDSIAPILMCPADTIVGMFSANCEGVFVDLPIAEAIDCNPAVSISNDSPFSDNNDENASGFYPPGIYDINFYADDDCGNATSCSMQIVVVDAKNPTPICKEIAVNLGLDGTVSITPEMVDNGSFDNCTEQSNLIIEATPNLFTCDELGDQLVQLIVTDEEGNSSFCETTISIQDNNSVCQLPSGKIAGMVLTESGDPVQLTNLILSGGSMDTLENDETGYFEFSDLLFGENYMLTPQKNIFHGNGISTFDLIFMRRHILGIQPLSTPYKMIAADVNKSGSITAYDIVILSRLILQIDTVLSINNSWRFVDASFVFPDPTDPFLTVFPESKSYLDLDQDELGAEFIGVKVGDVNGNANPAQLDHIDDRSDGIPLVLKIPDKKLEAGKEYSIPVAASEYDALLGYQFTLEFDNQALAYLGIEKGNIIDLDENNFGFSHLDQGFITTNWINRRNEKLEDGTNLFQLKFRALKTSELENLIKINSKKIASEAYDSDLKIVDVTLEYIDNATNEYSNSQTAKLYQNYPNPFDDNTAIGFDLPESGNCIFTIFNLNGQQISLRIVKAAKGFNKITMNKREIGKNGLYYYRLTIPSGESLIRKLIVK